MNFRLLSNTLIAPAGRRLSGADIFAPPAEVCGTNFPLPLPCLWGSVSRAVLWAFLFSSLNKQFSISCKMPVFFIHSHTVLMTSTVLSCVQKSKVCTREPLPDCIGAGGLSLSKFPSNPIIKRNAHPLF